MPCSSADCCVWLSSPSSNGSSPLLAKTTLGNEDVSATLTLYQPVRDTGGSGRELFCGVL